MEDSTAALKNYQIRAFFLVSGRPTQQQREDMAINITGERPTPTPVQGRSSYTVIAGEYVVRFRAENAALDLEFLGHVEEAYHDFMPWHSGSGTLGNIYVYNDGKGGRGLYIPYPGRFIQD
ncbi:MAG: hypothetical protein Q9207_004734 [Kuettlingeria erythrocarpa]